MIFNARRAQKFYFSYNVSTVACNATLTLLWELHSTLVTWAWDACVPIGSWSSELMTGRFCCVIHWRSWWWTCVHFTRWLDVECVKYNVGHYLSFMPHVYHKNNRYSRGNNKQLTIFWSREKRADHAPSPLSLRNFKIDATATRTSLKK